MLNVIKLRNYHNLFLIIFKNVIPLLLCMILSAHFMEAVAQTEKVELFSDDLKEVQEGKKKRLAEILKTSAPTDNNLKFDAPNLEYDKETQKIKGDGGVVISYQGFTVQADEGSVETETKNAELKGNVFMAWPDGDIGCDSANLNLESETGVFYNSNAIWEDGQYKIAAEKINKVSEFDYRFDNSSLTTCHCADNSCPWSIKSNRLDARQEGYGVARGTWFEMYGVPVFYMPYMIFPVKAERQSGLLAPRYGYSSEDGVSYWQPIFAVIDDQTDLLLEPFIEAKTRRGTGVEFRKVFSQRSNLTTKFLYSDESPRDGDLRGVITDGMYDPTFDEDRYGVYVNQSWRSEQDAEVPLSLVTDVHYVSDDLFLREMDDSVFGLYNQRYATSTMLGTASFGDYLTTSIGGEYNQALFYDNDDLIFQRLPEVTLSTKRNFRPFGYTPYGLKLQTAADFTYTEFSRDLGYDGSRFDLNPTLKMPYHYKNYLNGEFGVGLHYTSYLMREDMFPDDSGVVLDDGDRAVPNFTYTLSTGIERVYDVDSDSPLAWLTSLGYTNRDRKLRRVKHVIEPVFGYQYIPDVEQDDLPLYDSLDRIRHKSLFLYGVKTSLVGRYLPDNVAGEDVPELTPEIEDLPTIDSETAFSELDMPRQFDRRTSRTRVRPGEVREVMSFFIRQTYDYVKESDDDETTEPFSDIGMTFTFDPTPSIGFSTTGNYDYESSNFSSWDFSTKFFDDRKDAIRLGYTYIDEGTEVSQLTAGLEVTLTDLFRAGYYTRFDEEASEFLENMAAIRYTNPCNCWHLDLGYRDRLNPDKTEIMLTLTFRGLGEIAQRFGVGSEGTGSF